MASKTLCTPEIFASFYDFSSSPTAQWLVLFQFVIRRLLLCTLGSLALLLGVVFPLGSPWVSRSSAKVLHVLDDFPVDLIYLLSCDFL